MENRERKAVNFTKLKSIFFVNCAVWLIILFVIIDSSANFNPIQTPHKVRSSAFSISPQGWGFFTRNPREDMSDIYAIAEDKQLKKMILPNASAKYFYGFNRGIRFGGSRLGVFMEQVPEKQWKNFNDFYSIILDSVPVVAVSNPYKTKIFFDNTSYLITLTKRVPWAWSKHKKSEDMPLKAVIVKVNPHERLD